MPWPPSSALFGSSEPIPADELLPEIIDEGALLAELLDDENIDKEDRLHEQTEQGALWLRFGAEGVPPATAAATPGAVDAGETIDVSQVVPADGAPQKPTLKRKRKPRGRSKSLGVTTTEGEGPDAESDQGDGPGEGTTERRVRRKKAKGKGKGTAHLNEDQLRFMSRTPPGGSRVVSMCSTATSGAYASPQGWVASPTALRRGRVF